MASVHGTDNISNNNNSDANDQSDGDRSLEARVESQQEDNNNSNSNNRSDGDGSLEARYEQQLEQLTCLMATGFDEKTGRVTTGEDLHEVFRKWDEDGNGCISKPEFDALLGELGFAADEIKAMYRAADANKDGRISYKEFIHWLCGPANQLPELMVHQRTDSEFSFSMLSAIADPEKPPYTREQMLELEESDYAINGERVGGCVLNGDTVELVPPRRRVNSIVRVRAEGNYGAIWEGWLLAAHLTFPAKMVHQRIGHPSCTELRSKPDRDRRHCIRGSCVRNGDVVEVLPPGELVDGFLQVKRTNGQVGWLRLTYLQEFKV